MTRAKSVAPSMSAAAMIIPVRISPAACGWRALPSIAAAASLPMPAAPPMTVSPAPMPAAKYASEFPSSMPDSSASMLWMHRHADEQRRQHRENVGLQEDDQDLDAADEERQRQREADPYPDALPDEHQAAERPDPDASRGHARPHAAPQT